MATYSWEDVVATEEMGPNGFQETMTNKQGLKLAGYFWPTESAKAVVVVCHGHGCFTPYEFLKSTGIGKPNVYAGSWVEEWNKAGFSVCGMDIQSHGRSEGLKGLRWYFESFDDLVDDLLQFRREELPKHGGFKDLPVFLCGISMGGCLASMALHKAWESGDFMGGVLLAPMLSLERVAREPINRILRPISSVLNWLAPAAQLVKVVKNEKFPDIQQQFDTDQYTSGGSNTRVRVGCEYLRVTSWLMSNLESTKFNFIAFHSDDDGFTDPEGSLALYEKSAAKVKTRTTVNNMWHFLTKEDGNENILRCANSWMEARLAEAAAAN